MNTIADIQQARVKFLSEMAEKQSELEQKALQSLSHRPWHFARCLITGAYRAHQEPQKHDNHEQLPFQV